MIQNKDKLQVAKALKKLGQAFNVELKVGAIELFAEGKRFEINFYPPVSSGSFLFNKIYIPAKFEIQTDIDVPHPSFTARINTPFDRFTESILGQHDFQTNNQQFDKQAHIEVADADWGTKLFMSPEVTAIISNIFKYGFHKVYSADNKLVIDCFVKTNGIPPVEAIKGVVKEVSVFLSLFPGDYVLPHFDNPADTIAFNYPLEEFSEDLKAAHDELWYGGMDNKTKLRLKVLLAIVIFAWILTCWRLFNGITHPQ